MKRIVTFIIMSLPALISAAGFIDHVDGTPYVWKPGGSPIDYKVDSGDLNTGIDNATARTIVTNAFGVWSAVSIASGISFTEEDVVRDDMMNPVDINASNYTDYISFSNGVFANQTNDTVVIFDEDGGIIDSLLGAGQSQAILGIASPGKFNALNAQITAGFALINGSIMIGGLLVDQDTVRATTTHELGHLLNLAHTQLNLEEAFNDVDSDDSVIPTMFPVLPGDPTVLLDLHPDDEFSMAFLYPNTTTLNATGFITGNILRKNEEGVRAVNVICRNNSNPKSQAVSWISDQQLVGNGQYQCGNLTTGDYTVEIEPITQAINIYDPIPPFIASEFYNNEESFDPAIDLLTEKSLVNVNAGAVTEDVSIFINEDGKLLSGIEVTGSTLGEYPRYNYFITIPQGATKVTFELTSENASTDLDLFGRCDGEFSLTAGLTSPVIYSADPNQSQQSDFAGITLTGQETVELSSSTTPSLEECTYHLLVQNFGESDETVAENFTLKATIEGVTALLRVNSVQVSPVENLQGEKLVMVRDFEAEGDSILVSQIRFEDIGTDSLENVETIRLYKEEGSNLSLSTLEDELVVSLSGASISDRKFLLSNLNQNIEDSTSQRYYLTYEFSPSSSRVPYTFLFLIVSLVAVTFKREKTFVYVSSIMLASILIVSCHNKSKMRFEPQIENEGAITAEGASFGENINFDLDGFGNLDSVADFFD